MGGGETRYTGREKVRMRDKRVYSSHNCRVGIRESNACNQALETIFCYFFGPELCSALPLPALKLVTDLSHFYFSHLFCSIQDGSLIRLSSDRSIYAICNQTKMLVPSMDVFVAHGFDTSNVTVLSASRDRWIFDAIPRGNELVWTGSWEELFVKVINTCCVPMWIYWFNVGLYPAGKTEMVSTVPPVGQVVSSNFVFWISKTSAWIWISFSCPAVLLYVLLCDTSSRVKNSDTSGFTRKINNKN